MQSQQVRSGTACVAEVPGNVFGRLLVCVIMLLGVMAVQARGQVPNYIQVCADAGPPAAVRCNGSPLDRSQWWWSLAQRNVLGAPRVVEEKTVSRLVDSDQVSFEWNGGECVPSSVPDSINREFMHEVKVKSNVKTSSTRTDGVEFGAAVASVANAKCKAEVSLSVEGNGEREETVSDRTTVPVPLCHKLTRTVYCNVTSVTVMADVSVTVWYSYVCNDTMKYVSKQCPVATITSTGVGYWGKSEKDVLTQLRRCVRCGVN